ncbi:MAG: hypothetical protein PHU25_17940 [Deltaproteobacteria bacterium]|nr:hypothetical protein [Deltaproteobacteria bacterium]
MLKGIDNLVLVSLVVWAKRIGTQSALAEDLRVSPAGLTRSLGRLDCARLVQRRDLSVVRASAKEYLVHGLRYVFPARVGTLVRGVPTAHSAPPLSEEIRASQEYVWPADFGNMSGLEIAPLHENVPALCLAHPELHPFFAVLDALRVGRTRDRELARRHLEAWLDER